MLETAPEANASQPETAPALWRFGLADVDAALPEGGLPCGALHEIAGDAWPDMTAATGFCLGLLRILPPLPPARGTSLWVRSRFTRREFGALYGHGLSDFGLTRPACCSWTPTARKTRFGRSRKARGLAASWPSSVRHMRQPSSRPSASAAPSRSPRTPVLLLIPPESARNGANASTAAMRWRIARTPGSADAFDTRLARLGEIASPAGTPLVATNGV